MLDPLRELTVTTGATAGAGVNPGRASLKLALVFAWRHSTQRKRGETVLSLFELVFSFVENLENELQSHLNHARVAAEYVIGVLKSFLPVVFTSATALSLLESQRWVNRNVLRMVERIEEINTELKLLRLSDRKVPCRW